MRRIPLPRFAMMLMLASLCVAAGCQRGKSIKPAGPGGNSELQDSESRPKRIVAQGRIEPTEGVVGVFAQAGDRVESFEEGVAEGVRVAKDKKLGKLTSFDSTDYEIKILDARMREARASVRYGKQAQDADTLAAQGSVDQVDAATKKIKAKQQQVGMLKRAYELAAEEHQRVLRLKSSSDLVSDQKFARSALMVDQAKTEWNAAAIQLQSLQESSQAQRSVVASQAKSVEAKYNQTMAGVPIKSMKVQREALEKKRKRATLPAPIDGTILKIYYGAGETIGRKPILQMANLEQMVCVAEVFENYFNYIEPGQEVTIRSPVFGDKVVKGEVVSRGRMILAAELKELDPFSKADVRVVEVTIKITDGIETAAALVHLQVEAEIKVD